MRHGDLTAPHNADSPSNLFGSAGTLVPLLRNYTLDPVDVHAVFPGGPRPSAKVRALVDFLVQEITRGV